MTRFATTRWSIVLEAGDGARAARALESICRDYRAPVLAYVRSQGRSPADAEDLTQEFFARLLERRWHTAADPARGRFRTFLLTALKRFLLDARDAEGTRKRGGGCRHVDWEDEAERLQAPASESPEHAFERAWAATVIEHACARLHAEAERAGRLALFERLAPFLGEPPDASDYRRIGTELSLRPNTVAVAVRRLRLRLRELVREEIAGQTGSAEAAELELQALRAALLAEPAAPGRAHAVA